MNKALVLDFGNTYQKAAITDGNEFVVNIFEEVTLKNIEHLLINKNIEDIILSSVINNTDEIEEWLNERFHFIKLNHKTPVPIINKYKTPETLGKDRLAAAVGAASLFPDKDVLSIDCGTAIKYDIVNSKNEYLGGGITPGLHLRFKALHTFTDKLPLIGFTSIPDLVGRSTFESISSGVVNGLIAEINGIIDSYKKDFENLNIVLTGGEMIYFEKSVKSTIFAAPNLVLSGLYKILMYNKQQSNA
ncbi:MAG: type III pantothenate kinase [Bacteroidales bacterium]|nr:type III pantothenate kinase [Bacteroidales bacterium]